MKLTSLALLIAFGSFTSSAQQTTLTTAEAEAYILKTLGNFNSTFKMAGAPGTFTYKEVKIEGCTITLKIDMLYDGYNSSHKKVQVIDLGKIEFIVQDLASSSIYIKLTTYNGEKCIQENLISTYYGDIQPAKDRTHSSLQIPSPNDAKLVEAFNVLRVNCKTR